MNLTVNNLCQLKHLISKFSGDEKKKKKCCKSWKDDKQCKKCPRG